MVLLRQRSPACDDRRLIPPNPKPRAALRRPVLDSPRDAQLHFAAPFLLLWLSCSTCTTC